MAGHALGTCDWRSDCHYNRLLSEVLGLYMYAWVSAAMSNSQLSLLPVLVSPASSTLSSGRVLVCLSCAGLLLMASVTEE